MRFRVTSIKKGYCEIWANTSSGERYQKLAVVLKDKDSSGDGMSWHWSAKHDEPPFYMPWFTYEFDTRRECIENCERWALKKLVERAIEQQTEESPHWHSPRRDAWFAIDQNSLLFAYEERRDIKRRLETFEEAGA